MKSQSQVILQLLGYQTQLLKVNCHFQTMLKWTVMIKRLKFVQQTNACLHDPILSLMKSLSNLRCCDLSSLTYLVTLGQRKELIPIVVC